MRQLTAFTKKEFVEVWRTRKFMILTIVFFLFGIMNPAIAKLTPWMMEQFSDTLENTGLVVTETTVDAMTSWGQFYKNVPMGLIVFLLMFSGILANELQKGTLINMITKGMSRKKILIAKLILMLTLWTFSYWMCFGITYGYNAYFWDNAVAKYPGTAAALIYAFGVWLIFLLLLMATLVSSGSAAAAGTGGVFFVCYLISILPDVKDFLPTRLMDAGALLSGVGKPGDYTSSLIVAAVLCVVQFVLSLIIFDKKKV